MKKAFIASLATSALVIGAFAMSASAYTFSNNLSVGSTGSDVVALQSWLVSKGFLTMPAGVSEGYFGSLTKAAVVAYQASVGLPSTGFVGPLTRADLNAGGSMASTASCPAGYSCAPTAPVTFSCPSGWTCTPLAGTTGGTVTGGATAAGITTPGVEGILSVTAGPVSNSVIDGGQLKAPILNAQLQAQDSDLAVQRITVDLGASTNVFNYVFSNLYVVDPTTGNVLASTPLNASTVVQSGNNYVVSLTGFNFIVPKGTYKNLVVEADVNSSILSQFLGTYAISIDANGVRAVDGAGIDQYGPSTAISNSVTINQSLSLNSQVNISLDGSTPVTQSVPVTDTTNGNYLGLPVLTFDMLAQNDNIHIHTLTVKFATTTGGNVTAAYLYNGSTLITSAAVASNGTATFLNLPDSGTGSVVIPQNTTATLTIKADVTAVTAPFTLSASIPSFSGTAGNYTNGYTEIFYNSTDGNANTIIGGASGNSITVLGKGLNVNLAGTIGLSTQGANTTGSTNTATSTEVITATVPVTLTAVGSNVYFGDQASTSPVFTFNVYDQNGNVVAQGTSGAVVTGPKTFAVPPSVEAPETGLTITTGSTLVAQGTAHTWELPQGSNVTLSPTFTIAGRFANGVGSFSSYTIGLASVNYQTTSGIAATPLTFMASSTLWRSSAFSTN